MRFAISTVAVFAAAVGLFSADPPKDKDKPTDAELIQGVWVFDSIDTGEAASSGKKKELSNLRFTFKKDEAAIQFGKEEAKFLPFKLADAGKSKALDVNPDDAKQAMKFLYTLEADSLVICLHNGPAGAPRPAEFKPNKDKGIALITLKRMKDEKKDK